MGTKENPGRYDCISNAKPDEPLFVLLARDPSAPFLVGLWALIREEIGEDPEKIAEARECAEAMEAWLKEHADEAKRQKALKVARLWERFEIARRPQASKR